VRFPCASCLELVVLSLGAGGFYAAREAAAIVIPSALEYE
jgi:hypothetical protein